MKPKTVTLVAKVQLLCAEEGGRKAPIFKGYRPTIRFDAGVRSISVLTGTNLSDDAELKPGGTYQMTMRMNYHEEYSTLYHDNADIVLEEGANVIGIGQISRVYFD